MEYRINRKVASFNNNQDSISNHYHFRGGSSGVHNRHLTTIDASQQKDLSLFNKYKESKKENRPK